VSAALLVVLLSKRVITLPLLFLVLVSILRLGRRPQVAGIITLLLLKFIGLAPLASNQRSSGNGSLVEEP
jgi:hypothetical protein